MDHLGVVDPTRVPGWEEQLSCHPDATVFHSSAWARVLSETYGYLPTYFTIRREGRFLTLIPFMEIRSWLTGTRGVSLPFTDECAPILSGDIGYDDAVLRVIGHAGDRGWKTLEFRGRGHGMGNLPASAEYVTHDLDLSPGEEVLSSRYRPNVQRNIRKAEREGISVVNDPTPEGVKEFYRLNCLTRREHGLPPQPLRFFENLRAHLLEKGFGTLLLARHKGRGIGGAVFLHFAGKAVYKFGASDRRHQELRPNNLIFREGIRVLCCKGLRTLSFGRTDLHHKGLRQFKLSWGTTEKSLQYAKYDVSSRSYLSTEKYQTSIPWESTMSKLPVPLLRLIGHFAYRHVG
ncbi:MAG: GNAT family N-acetyltransferase [Deltaproteobacteria bacterium]|nr:MAG: GNAT family N-acetyltransferase [Deltaproteobacteria bacterium]